MYYYNVFYPYILILQLQDGKSNTTTCTKKIRTIAIMITVTIDSREGCGERTEL